MFLRKLYSTEIHAKADTRLRAIYLVGGWATLIITLLFFIPMVDLATAGWRPGTIFENNFIVLIFKLHAGFKGIGVETLEVISPLDITLMVLFGVVSLALYATLRRVNKVWAAVAVSLLPVGLIMYWITGDTGRSGIIAASFIFSILMLKSDMFSRRAAYLGVLASTFLLISDAATGFGFMKPFAVIVGVGYSLFVIWLFGLAWRFLRMQR